VLAVVVCALAGLAAGADSPPVTARLGSERFRQANRVEAITYSTDGKYIATGDGETVLIWNAADGKKLHRVRTGGPEVFALRFTPDGRTLAAAITSSKEFRLLLVDPTAGKVRTSHSGQAAPLIGTFSPDAAWLLSRTEDGKTLQMLDAGSGQAAWTVTNPDERFHSIAFRPDGKVVAVGDLDARVHIHDTRTGRVDHDFSVGRNAAWYLAYSPDGHDLVAALSSPGQHRIARFDAATGEQRWSYRTTRARGLAFAHDGTSVFYYGVRDKRYYEDDQWHRLDARTGKRTGDSLDSGYGHSVAFRPDGKVLAVGGFHGRVAQWDLATRKRLMDCSAEPPGLVSDLRFRTGGTTIRGWSRGWYEWDVKTGKQTRLTPLLNVGESERIAVSHDHRWLLRNDPDVSSGIAEPTWRVELVDLMTGVRRDLDGLTRDDEAQFQFLPDGRLLATGKTGLRIYDPATGKTALTIPTGEDHEITVSEDGTVAIATASAGDGVKAARWDLTAGRKIGEWIGLWKEGPRISKSVRRHGQISPDGKVLAICSVHPRAPDFSEYYTSLFDIATGRYLGGWPDIASPWELTFSPDNRSVAIHFGSILGVEIRETATGQLRRRFAHRPTVFGCRFSPDGRSLAVSTSPGPIELWDLIGDRSMQIGKWGSRQPAALWGALASADGEVAFDAIRFLVTNAAEAVPFLKERVPVPVAKAPEWVAARIKALDAASFRDREKATADLAAAGEIVTPELQAAIPKASAEARERLTGLLAKAEVMTSDRLRVIRACEALEMIGTTEAKVLLAEWAKGAPGATLSREAAESLERLSGR